MSHNTVVESGASIDLAGFSTTISDLSGAGAVIDSGARSNLDSRPQRIFPAGSRARCRSSPTAPSFSAASTPIPGPPRSIRETVSNSASAARQVRCGGGDISDAGALSIDVGNAVTLTGAISGAGSLQQIGTGVTSINTANTYTGGTTISAGTLAIGDGGALGTGTLSVANGELLGTASATVANPITLSAPGGAATFAAAPGTTLTLTGALTLAGENAIDIGTPGEDGDILWESTPVGALSGDTFDVLDGTVTAGSPDLEAVLSAFSGTTVEAGATLDWAGNVGAIESLQGAGTVTNSGAAQTMVLDGATDFSGTISGALSVGYDSDASLSGLEDYTGDATLNGPIALANSGVYDIVADNNIFGTPASSFVNNGVLEKTGGGGVSDVTSNFVNNGALNVFSGSIQFSGGFTNDGVIHGLVTESGGVTTVSAAVPSDFNGDGLSDILFQNAGGQAAVWEMNGTTPIDQEGLSPNLGPTWQAIGTGDFNGDGHSDILWQNTNGQAAIWEMNGTTPIDQQAVGPNPGPTWQAIGTGDFNGDGDLDILWQNANGQVAIWEMNGTNPIDQQAVGPNPGPDWKAINTGDFNHDGDSDILFQNANGQVAIWEMNGTTAIDQQAVKSGAVLAGDRDGRLHRRWLQGQHPVSEHKRAARDLGNERDDPDRRAVRCR